MLGLEGFVVLGLQDKEEDDVMVITKCKEKRGEKISTHIPTLDSIKFKGCMNKCITEHVFVKISLFL